MRPSSAAAALANQKVAELSNALALPTMLRPRTGALRFGCGLAALCSFAAKSFGLRQGFELLLPLGGLGGFALGLVELDKTFNCPSDTETLTRRHELLFSLQSSEAFQQQHFGGFEDIEEAARGSTGYPRSWHIVPASLVAISHSLAERIARRLCELGLLPEEEVPDSFILAEGALLGCSMLLTNDEYFRGSDFERLTFELQKLAGLTLGKTRTKYRT